MSESQNRGIRDFSKYDTMETEELEQILRLDAEAPEGTESDTEELFYIMEVLAQREKYANITGKTAQEAWESFQENYMPISTAKQKRGITARRQRSLIAAAAAIALVILIPISAQALSWDEFWGVVARWAKETFSFVSVWNTEVSEPVKEDDLEYTSIQDILKRNNRDYDMVPTKIPEGFVLEKVEKAVTPIKEIYTAIYLDGDKELKIQVRSYLSSDIQNAEITGTPVEVYLLNGVEYFLVENENQIRASWKIASYECLISGDLSIEEIKMMIDSIRKG